ncbi:hypothetical protein B0H11DRAFT_2241509 [Mycena galericulata]|nr:hypothetical protein B0H11DRAFT_2241509 [Mycena galericulata]
MDSLPPELICRVLEFAVYPFQSDPLGFEDRKHIVVRVCKAWRRVVFSAPVFWSCVFADSDTPVSSVSLSLSRSGVLPIHLYIELLAFRSVLRDNRPHAVQPRCILDAILAVLSPSLPRCYRLSIHTHDSSASRAVQTVLPMLLSHTIRHLCLDLYPFHSTDAQTTIVPVGSIRNLRVSYHGALLVFLSRCCMLFSLALLHVHDTPWTHILLVLHASSHLAHLILVDVSCPVFYSTFLFAPTQYCRLPFLSTLELRLEDPAQVRLVSKLETPSLRTVLCVVWFTALEVFLDLCLDTFSRVEDVYICLLDLHARYLPRLLLALPDEVDKAGTGSTSFTAFTMSTRKYATAESIGKCT